MWNVGLWLRYNVYEEDNLCNVVSTMLKQHYVRILFSQCCEIRLRQHCTRNADLKHTDILSQENWLFQICLIVCFEPGTISLNNLGSFFSMLARKFIWKLWGNNEQGPTLTGTKWWNTILVNFMKSFVIVKGKYSKI